MLRIQIKNTSNSKKTGTMWGQTEQRAKKKH